MVKTVEYDPSHQLTGRQDGQRKCRLELDDELDAFVLV